jgi:hypothetical protein
VAGSVVVGWILIGLGILFVLGGLASAIAQELRRAAPGRFGGLAAEPAGFVAALSALIEALARAPLWLALTAVGFLLIVFGTTLALPRG